MSIEGIPTFDNSVTKAVAGNKQSLDQQDFMNLLLKELSYQDPMNPMDNKEFTTQMTQFSSLEKLGNINDTLVDVLAYQQSMQNATVTNMIGKSVKVDGDTVNLNETSEIEFDLAADAQTVKLTIKNADGEIMNLEDLGSLTEGSNKFIWNGEDNNSKQLANGKYTFDIEALDSEGEPVSVITKSKGSVTDIVFEEGLTYLVLDNNRQVFLSDIQSISE